MNAIGWLVLTAWLAAACSAPAPKPRAPEHDLDEPQHRHDTGSDTARAGSGSGNGSSSDSGSAVEIAAPGVAGAEQQLAALAADARAPLAAAPLEGPDLNARCMTADIALDKLHPQALAAAPAAVLVRRDPVRAQHMATLLPISELSAAITACRVHYQMQLPGMEGLIDELQALVSDR